jgi:hypothetical protein
MGPTFMNKWISVKDFLPINGDLLITDGHKISLSFYSADNFYVNNFAPVTEYVTHWMYIPELPDEREKT